MLLGIYWLYVLWLCVIFRISCALAVDQYAGWASSDMNDIEVGWASRRALRAVVLPLHIIAIWYGFIANISGSPHFAPSQGQLFCLGCHWAK